MEISDNKGDAYAPELVLAGIAPISPPDRQEITRITHLYLCLTLVMPIVCPESDEVKLEYVIPD